MGDALDPISMEPLRALRYPPFECKPDPTLAHRTAGDWVDGSALASYLVSTGNFSHPISRRPLARDECVALDQYLAEHKRSMEKKSIQSGQVARAPAARERGRGRGRGFPPALPGLLAPLPPG